MPRLSASAVQRLLDDHFARERFGIRIESLTTAATTLRLRVSERHLRPGATVSGPTLMTLADCAVYVAVLGEIGPRIEAVTSSLTISFLRRAPARDVLAVAQLLKLGQRLAVGEVTLSSEGETRPIAHATVTYALPVQSS